MCPCPHVGHSFNVAEVEGLVEDEPFAGPGALLDRSGHPASAEAARQAR